ncbi:MAG: porin [Thermodesulfobacteriota bacterium]|nr:porin [Thermodesulfobacteriota bacterium]
MKKLFILIVAVAMVAAFTVPAMAEAEWNFYGSARFTTFSVDDDPDTPGVDSDRDTTWDQQGNSRIGATVKFNDEIGGGFEMSDSFGKRKLYGTYNFGAGQLLIGQTYTPADYFYSNSVYDGDGDLLGVGQFYSGRLPMIQLKVAGFKVALVKPNVEDYTQVPAVNYDADTVFPKIELSYGFKTDMFFFDVFGGYQVVEYESTTAALPDADDVESYILGGGGGVNFGPVFIKAMAHISQNAGDYGSYNPHDVVDSASISPATGNVEDNDGMGYLGVVGFKLGDAATIEGGYGYQENDTGIAGDKEDETSQYYVNCTINIAPGFFIVPEVGKIDRDKDENNADEGDITYFGAKWQINF